MRGTCQKILFETRKRFVSPPEKIKTIIAEYDHRIDEIEGYVYMNCVGVQLEKHFSKKRADELAGKRRLKLDFLLLLSNLDFS